MTLPPNRPANAVQLERDLTEVEKLYGTRGYLAARVQSRPAFDDGSRTVNYALLVSEGPQYHMGQLAISGVDESAAARLVHDSELHPGDPFNAAYWNDFLKKYSRDLPPNPHGWKGQSKVTMHNDSKTVDVTVALSSAHP